MELNGHGNIIWAGWDELILEGLLEKIKFWVCGRLGKSNSPPEDEPKERTFSGEQRLKKYPNIILIPTRHLGVSICLKGRV